MKILFKFLFPYMLRYKYYYLLGAIFIIGTNACFIFVPKYLEKILDIFTSNQAFSQETQIYQYTAMIAILGVGILFFRTFSRICFFNPGRFVEYEIKNDTLEHLTYMQKDFFATHSSGAILSRIQYDINGIRLLSGFGVMQVINIIVVFSLIPYQMVNLSLPLTLYSLIPIVTVFTMVRIVTKILAKIIHTRMQLMRTFSTFILSSLAGIDVVKNYMLFQWCNKKFSSFNSQVVNLSIQTAFIRSFFMSIVNNLENLLVLMALFIGGLYITKNEISIGQLIAFISYAGFITAPMMGTGWLLVVITRGIESTKSLHEITQGAIPELAERNTEPLLLGDFKELRVQNLTFAYPDDPNNNVLDNISFTLKKGESIGLFGKLGSGKTTLVNLLNHYLPVPSNSIFINDVDITTIKLEQLRNLMRTASQETFLFDNTVKENILLGLTEEERNKIDLKEIFHMSALEQEIKRFPHKENTLVGEKGLMLSGGQKQRLSLARAFIRPCSILILDNILSAVDTKTEHFLLNVIKQKTTSESQLIISHRIQAMVESDKILVFDQGKIIDKGTYNELIAREGVFKQTWHIQEEKK